MTIEVNARSVHGFVYAWEWLIRHDRQIVVSGTEDTEEAALARARAVLEALTGPLPVS